MKVRACVGCGYCCIKHQCAPSEFKYGLQDTCPALYWDGALYRCRHAEEWKSYLFIGEGCCSSLNTWRKEVRRRLV